MVRIVHLCSTLSVEAGGLSRAVLDSVDALILAGARVDLISYDSGTHDFPWKDVPPASLQLSLIPAPADIRVASAAMKEQLRDAMKTADVVHLHGMWEPLLAAAATLARGAGVPYICSIHGMLDPWSVRQSRLKKWVYFQAVERRRLGRAAALHFTAAEEAKKASPWLPAGVRRVVIPCILDLAPYANLPERHAADAMFPDMPATAPWILFLSRIHEKKGLDLLLRAFAGIGDKNAHLVIAGNGEAAYVQQMKSLAASLDIAPRAHFAGVVKGGRKIALLRRASMLAIPTSQENFGLVFPEALCCETPVLLTEGVDIHREILAANAGLLIRRDPADITKAIDHLLEHPGEAIARGQAGREWVFRTLDPSVIAGEWMRTYGEIARPAARLAGAAISR